MREGAQPHVRHHPWPQYGAPAQLIERFSLDSTDGPIEHLKTGCPSKHWLTRLAETVNRHWPHTPESDLLRLVS